MARACRTRAAGELGFIPGLGLFFAVERRAEGGQRGLRGRGILLGEITRRKLYLLVQCLGVSLPAPASGRSRLAFLGTSAP